MATVTIGTEQRQQIEAHLGRVQASPQFRRSQRRSELLGWAVRRVLAGQTEPVKEYQIGREVFGKPETWDPRIDPIVRVEFTRLRRKLREYYAAEGAAEPIAIEFPAGSYVPAFVPRLSAAETSQVVAPVAGARPVPGKRRWPFFLAAALIVFGIAGYRVLRRESAAPPVTTVAVLPFLDLTPGGQRQYLADGFSDELTNSLAMVPRLRAISRTSAFQFKGKNLDVREIGRRLAAGAVVEGSISIEGDKLRVIVQLDRTTDGTHLWQAEYDRKADQILAIESEVAQSVAHELDVRLTGTPRKFDPGPLAFDEYLKGVYEEKRSSPAALRAAMGHYENALRIAPQYAMADVRLASVHLGLSGLTGPSQQSELEQARRNLQAALSAEPDLPLAVSGLALINYILDWDWRSAEAGFQRALELSPGSSGSHQVYAWALMTRGRFTESERQYHEAIQMDPLNPLPHYDMAVLFCKHGQFAAARSQLEPFLQRDPMWFQGRLALILTDLYENRPGEASKDLELARQAAPESPTIDPLTVMTNAAGGRRDQALALLRQMETQASRKGYVRYHLALAGAFVGDRTRLFYWLGKSVDAHEQHALSMRIEPAFAPYQQDERMVALERRIGLLP